LWQSSNLMNLQLFWPVSLMTRELETIAIHC